MKCDLCEEPAAYLCCCKECLRLDERGVRRYHGCRDHFTEVTLAHIHDLSCEVEWVEVP